MDSTTMPIFEESMMGADNMGHGMHPDMNLSDVDATMSGMMDANGGDLLSGLEGIDLLPMMEVNLNDAADSQNYSTAVARSNNNAQQQGGDDNSTPMVMADNNMTGAGAGPLPTGFGAPTTIGGGSTLTEFTKRRNWSQRVLEELQDFLHILTPDGRMIYVSQSAKALTGHSAEDLQGKFIMNFIHPDDSQTFMREFNESISSGNPLRFFYRFRKIDGQYTIFESHGHPHLSSEADNYGAGGGGAGFCRGFFMMARPYPTKNAALLDSFLEHKIENERLTKKINDLKREEQEEIEAQKAHLKKKQEGHSSVTPSETLPTESGRTPTSSSLSPSQSQDFVAMPPPARPVTNAELTRDNLQAANASRQQDSISDKMARYEGATHIETIEMLTGLKYREGERAQGISTGGASPTLVHGDAGIPIPVDKDTRGAGDKKKKVKMADEYVCTDCGTLDSPEWRKGPNGPKTLCNACGLRWAKKEKKRTGPPGTHNQPSTTSS